jgi:hypothetical protein
MVFPYYSTLVDVIRVVVRKYPNHKIYETSSTCFFVGPLTASRLFRALPWEKKLPVLKIF